MNKLSVIFLILLLFSNSAFSQTQLSFRFSNPLFIEESPPLFQFDVEVKANESGTFLRDFQIYLDYSPSAFGAEIVANNMVTVTSLGLSEDHYQIVNQTDNNSIKFAVITAASREMEQIGSAVSFNEVPVTYTGLLRFQFKIINANATCGISFDQELMNGGQYMQPTTSTDPVAYQANNIYENAIINFFLPGHDIGLTSGWAGISSYLIPFNDEVEIIFNPIINELVILQNFSGFYFPADTVNTLGNWSNSSGYMVKIKNDCQLKIIGSETNNKTLNLTTGWNLIPVLSSCEVNTAEIFAPVLPNLVIAKEVAGTGVFWPELSINSLPVLMPGKAYFVKMATNVTISFPGCE